MTRLAIVKEQLEQTKRRLSETEIAAHLALTSKPDAVVARLREQPHSSYRLEAYGLDRADGGYIVQRFRCKGQTDTVSFWAFETWKRVYGRNPLFTAAAGYFNIKQHEILFPREERNGTEG